MWFLCWLLVVGYDLTDAPGELGAVVSPDSRTPVAVATGLRSQQVEQRVAVPGSGALDARGCDPLVKQGAGPLHGHEHRVVALDPGDVVSPAAPFHVETPVLGPQLFDHLSQPVRSVAWDHALPDPCLEQRLDQREVVFIDPHRLEPLEVFGDVHDRCKRAGARAHYLEVLGREFVHHHTAVLPIGDLGNQWGYLVAGEIQPGQTLGLIVWLHLADQLRVTALCLDHGRDGSGVTPRVCADEAVREMAVLRSLSIRLLDGVFLDEDPLVAAVDEGLHELVGHVGLVGKRHFCGREAAHSWRLIFHRQPSCRS